MGGWVIDATQNGLLTKGSNAAVKRNNQEIMSGRNLIILAINTCGEFLTVMKKVHKQDDGKNIGHSHRYFKNPRSFTLSLIKNSLFLFS